MLKSIRYVLQGAIALIIVSISTIVITFALFLMAILRRVSPKGLIRNTLTRWCSWLGELWVAVNNFVLSFYAGMEWDVQLPDQLDKNSRYLLLCNHQSWVDILVLQSALNKRAPFLRFMLKHQLIYVPVLGVAWWALDMPFLRRYSRQELLKDPGLRGKDLENAAKACENLKHIPVSMTSFAEGTRFTAAKHEKQKPPYRYLLLPRSGGIGQVLYSFGDNLQNVIDVTIYYPDGIPTFWQLVSGQVRKITMRSQIRSVDENLRGINFRENKVANQQLKKWLNDLWAEKDRLLIAESEKKS